MGHAIYVYLECHWVLHEWCPELPLQLKHPFHPQHPLTLLVEPDYNNQVCGACWNAVRGLVAFHCFECEFGVHLVCASLMPNDHYHQYLGHPHPLILCEKTEDYPMSCYACQGSLETYVCVCLQCSFLLHKSCANLPREVNRSPCHNLDHPLTLLDKPPPRRLEEEPLESKQSKPNPAARKCDKQKVEEFNGHFQCHACDRESTGYAYACRDCLQYFDVRCAINEYKLHDHPLFFFNMKKDKLKCNTCHQPLHTPFFRCGTCNFNLHVGCLPILPQYVKHKVHRHFLTLTYSPIRDCPDEDETADFYCDACEGRRQLSDPTYNCEECHFVAHVHCGASEALRILVEEWSLDLKLGETKQYAENVIIEEMKGSHETADEATTTSSNSATTEEAPRFSGDSLLIELDEELGCLYMEKEAVERRKLELESKLKELEGKRAPYLHQFSSTKQ